MGQQIRALPEVQVVNESGTAQYRGTGGSTNHDTARYRGTGGSTNHGTARYRGTGGSTNQGLPDTKVQVGQRITTLPDTEVQAGQCRTQRQATGMGAHASLRLQAGRTNHTSAWTYTGP